jgi:hypothetical protein
MNIENETDHINTNLESETEHDDPQGHEDLEEQEEPRNFLKMGTDLVTGAVHEKLTLLPRNLGLIFAIAIILGQAGFVIALTYFNYNTCPTQIANIDGDHDDALYKDVYKEPTYLCATLIQDPDDEFDDFFIIPCLLPDFTCDDYGDSRCPDAFFECPGDAITCVGTVSVVSILCPEFTVAFGAAFGLAVPVQLTLLIITFAIYLLFFKKTSFADTFRELEEVVASKTKKEFSKKELEDMVAAQSSRLLKDSITKSERENFLAVSSKKIHHISTPELEESSSSELVAGSAKEKNIKPQQPEDEEVA